ncbi:MAG TPA: L-aspartate oxidase [Gammaproteobacteria bacterium]|jgi:L-aspartate oxidase
MSASTDKAILIVGGGIGGLSVALRLADRGHAVTVLTKGPLERAASFHAQGGIAAVMDSADSLSAHQSDTEEAGAGLCHADVVARVVERGPDCIRWLEGQGVRFTRNASTGELHLTQEGGHSSRRIVHADDATGVAVMSVLAARAQNHSRIEFHDNCFVTQLLTSRQLGLSGPDRCVGVRLINELSGLAETLWADAVILATGGASGLYEHATNYSTGDGIAMAWRAGCRVANLEFIQFHPTCLYDANSVSVLITEAVRGEGGVLKLPDGTAFMRRYDERADLAPRDIVSRAIVAEMRRLDLDHVYLDISHEPAAMIRERFPNVLKVCAAHGYDLTKQPVPVVPAAHYTCGGIVVDARSQTDVQQLYALGECSFTGLHGANRLASNSLLEALAFAAVISDDIETRLGEPLGRGRVPVSSDRSALAVVGKADSVIEAWTARLRRVMWTQVGIIRTREGLERARLELDALEADLDRGGQASRQSCAALEFRNLVTVARLVTESARRRHESRGLHFNADYPKPQPEPRDTALQPVGF